MSQITIEVVNVGAIETVPTKNGRSYQQVEIAYKKDGKIEGKKLVDFTDKAFFKAALEWKPGDILNIISEKNEKGYWQWVGLAAGGGTTNVPAGGKAAVPYTADKDRQIMIVRQSSLGHAVATLAVGSKGVKPEDVIAVAKQYEAFVLGTEPQAAAKAIDDLKDDIPY